MAKISVEVKSKDMIKPFSQTPNHLKTLQFSLMDQFAPPVFTPCILFYQTEPGQNNNSQATSTISLKNSLSKTLVQFYPLAGRIIEGNLSINCNDEGVEYYEADVLESLAQVIAKPDPEELVRLLPFAPLSSNKSLVAAVQVNQFSCGGIAVSVCISHKIVDTATFVAFVKAWGLNARGVSNIDDHTKLATFDSASFFPPMDLNGFFDDAASISKEKIVTRRLIFDKEKLDEMKRQCDDPAAARVSLVSAFLWKKFIKIAKAKPTPLKIFGVLQIINLRTIKESPIPENYCGNLFGPTFVQTQIEPEIEYTEAVGKLSTAVKMDASYLPKIKTGECYLELLKVQQMGQGEADSCAISSWTRFPMYEVNFGWGTPTWVSTTTLPFKNSVVLMPTKCGQGIEAWMNLLQHDVAAFEQDHEFRSLASHIIQESSV